MNVKEKSIPALAGLLILLAIAMPVKGDAETALTPENILDLANQDRLARGLAPLRFNARLQNAATAKALDMLENDYFSHSSPAGTTPWDFIRNQGYKYIYAGENLASNYTSPYELVNDFLNSPSHRENLLSPFFTDIGIAVIEGKINGKPAVITVQVFATPAGQ